MRITIIGPRSVGKTTTARLLAKRLGYAHEQSDKIMDVLLKEQGGLSTLLREKNHDVINDAIEKRFDTALQTDNVVFDLAGGSLTIKQRNLGERTRTFIRERSVVIGLLPCKEVNTAIRFLYGRERLRSHFSYLDDAALEEKVARNYAEVSSAVESAAHLLLFVVDKAPERIVDEVCVFLDKQAKAL